jgi:hypothetical protein
MERSEVRDDGADAVAGAERNAPDYTTAKMPSLHPGYARSAFEARAGGIPAQDRMKKPLMLSRNDPEAASALAGGDARCSTTTRRLTSPFKNAFRKAW